MTFGSRPAAPIDANADGLRPNTPFARTIPWADTAGADLHEGQVRVWTTTSRRKPAMSADMAGWNAVVLPRVVALTRPGRRP